MHQYSVTSVPPTVPVFGIEEILGLLFYANRLFTGKDTNYRRKEQYQSDAGEEPKKYVRLYNYLVWQNAALLNRVHHVENRENECNNDEKNCDSHY
jgi:hypothetical protein